MKFTTNINQLYNALNAGLIHASKDETRPHLIGVFIDITQDDGCKVVATDGHRMSVYDLVVDIQEHETGKYLLNYDDTKILLSILKKHLKYNYDIIINTESKRIDFIILDQTVAVRLKDEEFPPWEQVIPDDIKLRKGIKAIGLNPLYVGDTAKAFGITRSYKGGVAFHFKGELDPVKVTCISMPELTIVIMPNRI
jgi:DNA polymerase III sliding clamp (beta) subunit (PCNA family)